MKYLAAAIAIPGVPVLLACAYFLTPSVYLERSARGLTVHCEVLHDYPSDVSRIDIVEQESGRIVWRVKARGEKFQLHDFDLVRGSNPGRLQPYWGDYRTEIPAQGSFYLAPGVSYRASVCSAGWFSICRTIAFML